MTSIITVTARTDDGISAFVVLCRHPVLIVEPAYRKLGWHASDTHGLTMDDCRAPADNLLGSPGQGLRNFLAILDDGRIAISAPRRLCAPASNTPSNTPRSAMPSAGRSAASRGRAPARPRRGGRERPQPHVQGRVAERPGSPDPPGRGNGQALLDRGQGHRDVSRHADPRRQGHRRHADRPLLPGRQDPGDRRGTSEIQRSCSPAVSAYRWAEAERRFARTVVA